MSGAPRDAYADPDFVIVRMTAVRELGSWEAAGCFQRIAWRCEHDGQWVATHEQIAEEIGVSVRTAKRITKVLRDRGWVSAERGDATVPTLTWRVLWAEGQSGTQGEGQDGTHGLSSESAKVAPSPESASVARGEGQDGTQVSASPALSSIPSDTETEGDKAGDEPPARRDLNEGRDDVERCCQHLSQRLTERQVRHSITKAWRDAARLMMDSDGRTEQQVHNMIEWSQRSAFWSGNIHSMPTLREKYDRMRAQAMRDSGGDTPVHRLPPSDADRAARVAAFGG